MSKFNLLTTLSLNAAGMSEGLQKAVGDIEKYVEESKGKNSILSASFRDVGTMGVGELRKELKSLQRVSFAGKTEAEILAINMRVGELMDTMGDLKSMQRGLGTEFGSLATKGIQGFAGLAEAGLGVAMVFGMDEKSAQKMQSTMIATMGAVQGLGEFQAMLGDKVLQSLAIRIKETAVTYAQAVATGVATAAQWLYNASLIVVIATIGAAVVVVAAVIGGIYLLTQAFSDNRKELDKQTKAYEALDAAHKRANDTSAFNVRIMKARGASDAEISKQELANAKTRQIQINAEMDALGKLTKLSDEQAKKFKELGDEYIKNGDEIIFKNIEVANSGEKHTKAVEKQAGAYSVLTSKISDTEEKIKNILATGGTVSPEMLAKLNQYKEKLKEVDEAAEAAFSRKDRVANIETRITSKTSVPEVKSDKKVNAAFEENLKKRHAISSKYQKIEASEGAKAAAAKLAIDKQTQQQQLGALADTFGNAASLFKENTIAYKAMASAQAMINAFMAAGQAQAAMSGIPVVGPALGVVAYGVALAQGIMAVAGINGVQFANGGIVPGSSYSGDNIAARLNSGEMVLNGAQQSNLFAMANGKGGGNGVGEVVFRIEGTTLVGVLNNHSKKRNNTR